MNKNPGMADEEIFAIQYSRLVTRLVRRYFLSGGDYDDLYQEGMIGLLNAIRKYDPSRSDNFEAYASLCIKSRLVDAMRRDISANDVIYQSSNEVSGISHNVGDNPEEKVLAEESAQEIISYISGLLSAFEASVLDLYLEGYTVKEISEQLNKTIKSVDNAIVRIRNKLRQYLNKRRQQE